MLPPPPGLAGRSSVHPAIRRSLAQLLILAASTAAWGATAIDQVKSTNQSKSSSSITSPSFSTTAANELLLAFISTDAKSAGVSVTGVSGASLTWVLVQRTDVQLGTAEIWRAFATGTLSKVTVKATLSQSVAASLTVVTLTGTDTTGTNGSGAIGATGTGNASAGAPTASLVTTRNGSWVFGVGNDWDNATKRTVGPNQTIINQYLASVGDTYWVQQQTSATPLSGTTVTINDTAPTKDRYNLSIVEVLPAAPAGPVATYAVAGTAAPTNLVSGAGVALSQNGTTITTTTIDGTGSYSFPSVANGTYTVTPSQPAVDFSPPSQGVTVNGGPAAVPAFTATQQMVSGTVTPATVGNGATVSLTQSGKAISTTTVISGSYSFASVPNGTYTVTPTEAFVVFAPTSQNINVSGSSYTVPVFTASAQTWQVSGAVTPANSGVATLVSLDGTASADGSAVHLTATANSSGNYTIQSVPNGSYTVTPSKNGYTFNLASVSVTINNGNGTANFTASPTQTYTVSGAVTPLPDGGGTLLTLSGSPSSTATADSNTGYYSFPGLGNNTYTVTPSKTGYTFTPPSQMVIVNGADMPNINFTANAAPPVAISISPTSVTVAISGTQPFTATVTGTTNTAVKWTTNGGTISSTGVYTAPAVAGVFTVTATSVADTTKSASATVTVGTAGPSTVLLGDQNVENQADSSLALGQAEAFQATANGSGSVQTLLVYLDSTSTVSQVVAGLYDDIGGHPGTLLNQGSSTQVLAGAWNTISLPSTGVVAGTPYWIAILGTGSGTPVLRDATGGNCPSETSQENSLATLPGSWTTGAATATCPASIFGDSNKIIFYDDFAGTTISPAWTVISRHGEYSQSETECNVPSMVTIDNGLTITTEAQSATCGDYFNAPKSWPYITGDIQWATQNFSHGTIEIEAKFPSVSTALWPATWLLGSNCQYTNPFTGNTGVTIDGHTCPSFGGTGYTEIDMTECYGSGSKWCGLSVYNPGGSACERLNYAVDANWHLFKTVWTSTSVTQYVDGSQVASCNQQMSNPMFLIIQTQTGGVAGTPNNSDLPATFQVQYVRVTQP